MQSHTNPSNKTLETGSLPPTVCVPPVAHWPITHTLALLPLAKRQVFCNVERLKMVKHQSWVTTIVVPKSVGSMTMKGQMKPTFRVSLTESQVGEKSQRNASEHIIVSSILTDLIFRRNLRRRTALSGPTIESAKQPNSSNAFPNSKSTQYHHKLQHKLLIWNF